MPNSVLTLRGERIPKMRVRGDEGAKVEYEKERCESRAQRAHLHPPRIRPAYLPLYKVAHALVFIDDTKSVRTD